MSTYISEKLIIPRRSHKCRICGEKIGKGETCYRYVGVEEGIGFYTLYGHIECWEYSRDWDVDDWETMTPGAVSREEILNEII